MQNLYNSEAFAFALAYLLVVLVGIVYCISVIITNHKNLKNE